MTAYLLDANVLIALTVAEHEHHDLASTWLSGVQEFATCPITEGALTRFLIRMGESVVTTVTILQAFHEHPRCRFWADSVPYTQIDLGRVRGHRQVTDAYLVGLASANRGVLATLDSALAAEYPQHSHHITA